MAYYPYYNGAMPDMLGQQKMQYQYPMPQQMPQPMPQPMQQQVPQQISVNDMIWVLGENEAQSWAVAPNNTVVLWDKNQSTIYLKSVNAQGVPSMRILDYSERTNAPQATEKHECKCGANFVKIEDFKALEAKFEALTEDFQALTAKKKKPIKEEIENG